MKKQLTNSNQQSGQVLLITVMLLATVLVSLFSISFNSQVDTQSAKLEEDSKRALAAAEAIMEASMKNPTGTYVLSQTPGPNNLNLSNLTAFTGSATVLNTTGSLFTTTLLQKDEQYTFYTSTYPGLVAAPRNDVWLYLDSESACPAVEITYVHDDINNSLTRDLVDPCNQVQNNSGVLSTVGGTSLNGIIFTYRTSSPITFQNMKMVLFRVLYNQTKLGIQEVNGNDLSSQGVVTTAQAQTNTSVMSTVKLFQSYPQIPSDFFVTSF